MNGSVLNASLGASNQAAVHGAVEDLADIAGCEAAEDFRTGELARRLSGPQGEELHAQL